jgi:hypothetical protein
MSPDRQARAHTTLWQGFHHAWEYNHRLNRFGSYVRVRQADDRSESVVGHTAASGTGGDTAHFSEHVTRVCADDVGFQVGWGETVVECMRAVTTQFRIKVDDLALAPALLGRDNYTVVINGFDLYAQRHSDKLLSFDLEITDPTIYADGTKIRFNILGSMCFDCRTAECQLWPFGLEIEDVGRRKKAPEPPDVPSCPDDLETPRPKRGIKRHPAIDKAVNWLKRQIVRFTDLESVKRWVLENDENPLRRRLFRILGKQFFLRLLKWRIATPYVLRVHYVIIGGDADALRITESDFYENNYAWDAEVEIHHKNLGMCPIEVPTEAPQDYAVNALAFKQLSLSTELDREFESDNPIQWGRGMHLLEWNVALRDVQVTDSRVTAQLDLFYKSWSEAMNEVITLTTWGALRSAGSATLGARLMLLQFKSATAESSALPGRIHWPGGGLNAKDHPRAQCERLLP